jgi:DNA polymerase IV
VTERAAEPILHVDMDAFYASVEILKDPSLEGRPVIVGGQGGRGVVTSASYEARAFGVRSAMPMVRARRLCPNAAFVSNDFPSYLEWSERIREVFLSYTPLVEPLSLDEAFLDVSGSVKLFGDPTRIARLIKDDTAAFGLTCTVGVASTKFVAKLASAAGKPDGLLVIPAGSTTDWLHPLPVEALWGVGERTAEVLRRLGLRTVGDIAKVPVSALKAALGEAVGSHLHNLAQGIDDRSVTPSMEAKSVGSEETFGADIDDPTRVLREVLRMSDRTAARLRAKSLCGRTVTLKIRFSNFRTITRSVTPGEEMDTPHEIYAAAKALFEKVASIERIGHSGARVRLIGVSITGLAPGPPRRQMEMLGERAPVWSEIAGAVDSIRDRFGDDAVAPAALLDK